jgi:hypothetical protein
MTVEQAVEIICEKLNIEGEEAILILEKAILGGEFTDVEDLDKWLNERFLPNIVFIDENGYARMCVDALKILSNTADTDYGGSRQRDLGQKWADMTRGYLGEHAFKKYLESIWKIECNLGHEVGMIQDYLPMDIHQVRDPGGEYRVPKIKISLKTSKWNGIWLDIPGAQFAHSDVHVFIKIGAGKDHLFAFFKHISVFKDKVLKKGEEVGSLTKDEASELFTKLPTFKPIPAYICGFVLKNKDYNPLSYEGKKGRKNYNITAWNGPIKPGDLDEIKQIESITGSVKFQSIQEFSHDTGYLFNTGNLLWQREEWQRIIAQL